MRSYKSFPECLALRFALPMRTFVALMAVIYFLGLALPSQAASTNPAASATSEERSTEDSAPPSAASILSHPAFEKFLERGAPAAEESSKLSKLMGEWNYRAAFWVSPDDNPKWTKGVFRNEIILDGRFLLSNVVGDLNIGGNDSIFQGHWVIGYEKTKKIFTSVWADTLGTGLMTGTGNYDPKTKTITENGVFTNPLTGDESQFKSTLEFTGDDDYKHTIFLVDKAGNETRLMEFDCSKAPTNDVWKPAVEKAPAKRTKKP